MVSVIIPTKNAAKTLSLCLKSLKGQTVKNIEIIVVDNYSTDDTQKIAKKFTKNVFLKGPERSAQRNFGAQKAKGNYIAWFDADMELTPTVIEESLNMIAKNNDIKALIIPEKSQGHGFWAKCKALEKKCYLGDEQIEAVRFVEKKVFEKVGKMAENFIAGEDWDITTRIRKNGYCMGRIEAFVIHHEGNLRLLDNLNKKYYYATKGLPYIRTHVKKPKDFFEFIFRPAFRKNWKLLASDPLHAFGLLFMKFLEFGVGALGIVTAQIKEHF